jgi:transcriptional regulator GlxA family with amidase domain
LGPVAVVINVEATHENGAGPARMRDGTLDRRRALLRDAITAIVADHGPGVDLDTVARGIGTSRRQLQRVFAELSERSFRDTLAAVRMGHARNLLATSERPIGEIARLVGYADPAQFTKAFRHHHGMPPRQFRRTARP